MRDEQTGPQSLGQLDHPRSAFPGVPHEPLMPRGRPKQVVVIGAGMAGLCAAYELVRAGHEVAILEARRRPGGRVYTVREPFDDGLYAEAGALFLPGHHNLTLGYARKFGLSLAALPKTENFFYLRGTRITAPNDPSAPWPMQLWPREQRGGVAGMWRDYVFPVIPDLGDPRSPGWPSDEITRYAAMTCADFLRSRGASPGAIDLLALSYFDYVGEDVATSAALASLSNLALSYTGVPQQLVFHVPPLTAGADSVLADEHAVVRDGTLHPPAAFYRIAGGNDRLPDAFAESEELHGRLHYQMPAVRIEGGGERELQVLCDGPRGQRQFTAERVICTVPFSVLRTMDLAVPLSQEKQRAIRRLEYLSVTRVWVETRTRFWRRLGLPPNVFSDLPAMLINQQTVAQDGERGILESFTAGARARDMAMLDEAGRARVATDAIRAIFPGCDDQLEGRASHAWDGDEWARGAYSWYRPGDMTTLMPYIAQAEGRLHVAGDHASALPGWIQGALESGLRAAEEVNTAP